MRLPLRNYHPVARYFVAILLIVVLEGAIRKWIWPGAASSLLAFRDSLVLLSLLYGVKKRWFRWNAWQESLLLLWSTLVICWAAMQVMLQIQSPLIALLGIRFWLLYFWFAWLCARTLQKADLEMILRVCLWIMLPMTILVIFQHFLPPEHLLNREATGPDAESERNVFTVVSGIVRTTGTFSFTSGYVKFNAFVCAAAIGILSSPKSRGNSLTIKIAVFLTFLASALVSGSRHVIIFAIAMQVGYFIALVASGSGRNIKMAERFLLLGFIAMLFMTTFLGRAIEATEARFATSAEHESFLQRLLHYFIISDDFQMDSLIGYGIGMGTNAASVLSTGINSFLLAEFEPERLLLEAGLLGMIFIGLKLVMAASGLWSALKKVRVNKDVMPWMLWLFAAAELLTAQINGQITVNAFAWLGVALALAAVRQNGPIVVSLDRPINTSKNYQ